MREQHDRYKLNLFYQGNGSEIDFYQTQEITDKVFDCENLFISTLPMDFNENVSQKYQKELERKWIEILPKLDNVTTLSNNQPTQSSTFAIRTSRHAYKNYKRAISLTYRRRLYL